MPLTLLTGRNIYVKTYTYFFVKIGHEAIRVGEMRFNGKMIIYITRHPWNATSLERVNVNCRGEACLQLPSPFNCVNTNSSSIINLTFRRLASLTQD